VAAAAVKSYIEGNEASFVNDEMTLEQNISHYVDLFTTPSRDLPTALFHWREYEVDEETGIPKKQVRLKLFCRPELTLPLPSIAGTLPKPSYYVHTRTWALC
jgi:hypothetical protein